MHDWRRRRFVRDLLRGDWQPMYRFNDGVLSDEDIRAESGQLVIGDLTIDTNERVVSDDWTIKS